MASSKVGVFLIDGFEEIEALTIIDVLRRGDVDVTTLSLAKTELVTGKHAVIVKADRMFDASQYAAFDVLAIPGGTTDYLENAGFTSAISAHLAAGKTTAAICAAPAVLAKLGLLKGRTAVCYPGMEDWLESGGATVSQAIVLSDGNLITSRGPSTALPFALKLLEVVSGEFTATSVKRELLA